MLDRLLTVEALLARDAEADLVELHRRDRLIGRSLADLQGRPAAQMLAWAEQQSASGAPSFAEVRRGERAVAFILMLLGFVLGCAAASGVLYYDGSGRVNVLGGLAVLVGVQLVTLVLTALAMFPKQWRATLPGLGAAQDALSVLSPGRWQRPLTRWLAPAARENLERVLAGSIAVERVYGPVRKWLVLMGSQAFAAAFNIGLVMAFLSFVTFTDLAFGWSTTLDLGAERVHGLAQALSAPWAAWLPQAVPSPELVAATRYYRAQPGGVADPALLGGWWTFVFACLVVYGLLPRLVLLGFARWQLARAFHRSIRHLSGAAELLYRLNHEAVQTQAEAPEGEAPESAKSEPDRGAPAIEGSGTVVLWAGLELSDVEVARLAARATGISVHAVHAAGGTASLDEDRAAINAAAVGDGPVVVLVKAWEPPLGDLSDFLVSLRNAVGAERPLLVVPAAEDASTAPEPRDTKIWRYRLAEIGDPGLTVRTLAREASS